jgi:hypothetical protein
VSRRISIVVIAMVLLSASCSTQSGPGGTIAPALTAALSPRVTATLAWVSGVAYVNSATLVQPGGAGVPFVLEVQGDLADGCTELAEIMQTRTA